MANPLTRLLDPVDADRDRVVRRYQFTADNRAWMIPLAVGVVGLTVGAIGFFGDHYSFWYSYLTAWVFCLSISIGALFFVMIQHVPRSKWVTAVRRFPEMLMTNFWLLALLGIPMFLFGMYDLYHWTHKELYEILPDGTPGPDYDAIVAGKRAYLNTPFFYVRMVAYFAVWITISTKLYRISVHQDTVPRRDVGKDLRRVSAWGIPLAAVATAFAGFDLIMSLDPHWFSTMFGIYFFAGGFLASIATVTFLALAYRSAGMLRHEVNEEHYHDLGKYLFAFTVFWTYIAFSQYMLIWYGNLPEETVWFQHRITHGWEHVTTALIWGHFILPFFILIPRFAKRVAPILAIMCVWTLVMHYIDLWWQIRPSLYVATHKEIYQDAAFVWTDFALWFGMVGLFFGATLWRASRHSITPYNDPYYAKSLRFQNI
ncbi:MAG: hypothetical protein AAGI91_02965 [Bacteroidota bacterium]